MTTTAYFAGNMEFKAPVSCTIDSTQPTFAGISSVTPNNDGSFTVNWASATSTKAPVRYEVYVALGNVNAATLFVTANRILLSPSTLTSIKVFVLRDQVTYFVNGSVYTFGVRAVDSQNYSDSNVVVLTSTAIASGNIGGVIQATATQLATTETNFAATEVLLAQDHANLAADHVNFQGDHTNFQSDHTNFASDHSAFGTDHSNFQTDHTNFQSDHTNFGTDHTALQASLSEFETDLTTMETNNTNAATNNTNLAAIETDLSSDATSIDTSATSLASSAAILSTITSGASISGGLSLELNAPILDMEIQSDEENL